MAILESVKELASKLGAETNGRDITDQLNKINKHLDETALSGRDIAEAVKTYSKNASGGGGGGETFEVEWSLTATSLSDYTFTSSKTFDEIVAAINNKANIVGTYTRTVDGGTNTFNSLSFVYLEETHSLYGTFRAIINGYETVTIQQWGNPVYYPLPQTLDIYDTHVMIVGI